MRTPSVILLLFILLGGMTSLRAEPEAGGDSEAEPESSSPSPGTSSPAGDGGDVDPETEEATTSTTTKSPVPVPSSPTPEPNPHTLRFNYDFTQKTYTFLLSDTAFLAAVNIPPHILSPTPIVGAHYQTLSTEGLVVKVVQAPATLTAARVDCRRSEGKLFEPKSDSHLNFVLNSTEQSWVAMSKIIPNKNIYIYNVSRMYVPEMLGTESLTFDIDSEECVIFGKLPSDKTGFKSVDCASTQKYICQHADPTAFEKLQRYGRYKYMMKHLNEERAAEAPSFTDTFRKLQNINENLPTGECNGQDLPVRYLPGLDAVGSVLGMSYRANEIVTTADRFNYDIQQLLPYFTDPKNNPRKSTSGFWCFDQQGPDPLTPPSVPAYVPDPDPPIVLWPDIVMAAMTILLTAVAVASLLFSITIYNKQKKQQRPQQLDTYETLPLQETRRVTFSSTPALPTAPPPPFNPTYPTRYSSSSSSAGPEQDFLS